MVVLNSPAWLGTRVAHASLELRVIFCLSLLSAGILGTSHHSQLSLSTLIGHPARDTYLPYAQGPIPYPKVPHAGTDLVPGKRLSPHLDYRKKVPQVLPEFLFVFSTYDKKK